MAHLPLVSKTQFRSLHQLSTRWLGLVRRFAAWLALADNGNCNAGNVGNFGGNWNNDTNAGAFQLNVNNSLSNANSNIGARLT